MFNTVAAISTPRGKGGIATIRVSGDETPAVIGKCFISKKSPVDNPRTAVFGKIVNGDEIIDTGLCTFFAEGASFTGEKSCEISCHGGTAVTAAVLSAVFAAGAEPAGPGEFTRRAFVNGKLSLTEAEAVGKLIDADTDTKRRLAGEAARGKLSQKTEAIRGELTHILAALYAVIDYPDEDIGDEGEKNLLSVLENAVEELTKLDKSYKQGSAIVDGVVTSICGSPNSGKSTLYNLICGGEKAIVTDIAGTTRDTLWETVDFGGITLRLADTAGIRETSDTVEAIGVDRAKNTAKESELILAVFDGSRPLTEEDYSVLDYLSETTAPVIGIINKSDVGERVERDRIAAVCAKVVTVSAKNGEGIKELEKEVQALYYDDSIDAVNSAVIWDARHKALVENALKILKEAIEGVRLGQEIDAISSNVEIALSEISQLDGRETCDEILAEIFSRFCVGK